MKVGDLVRYCSEPAPSQNIGESLGTVVSVREGTWPIDWDLSDDMAMFEMKLGKRADVLWEDGSITENHSARSLKIVIEDDSCN